MEFILLILKIILIAFLLVLGLILVAVGLILFVPIRYELSGSIGDSWEVRVNGRLTYLLSIIKVLFSYAEEQFNVKLFLFGFEKKMQKEDTNISAEAVEEGEVSFHEKAYSQVAEHEDNSDQGTVELHEEQTSSDSAASEDKSSHERKSLDRKKAKNKNNIDFGFWKQQLTDEHNKSVVRKIWSELCYLLKHFKFRKIVTDLVFATGDPATTGQALGILCMIPSLYRYNFKIVPDFETDEAYIKGTFLVAGKVRLIHILITLLRLIFDKEVRLVVKRILRLLEQ